jgi:hypothetical protein
VSAVVSPPPVSTIDLPYEGPSAREARHWARGVLVLAEVVDDEAIDNVVRCFAELVSNSQVHTGPSLDRKEITCRLVMTMAEVVTIRGEVIDAGSPDKRPTARQVGSYADTGRGLSQVVKACADEWGYERTPGRRHGCMRSSRRHAAAPRRSHPFPESPKSTTRPAPTLHGQAL